MTVIIERISPIGDSEEKRRHDREKWLRLRGRIEGSPWIGLTATWNLEKFNGPDGRKRLDEKLAKFKADVVEYHGRGNTVPLVEQHLMELGIKIAKPSGVKEI